MMARAQVLILVSILVVGCVTPEEPEPSPDGTMSRHASLLWSSPFPNLTVEIDYGYGLAPSPMAIEALESTLRSVTSKANIRVLRPTEFNGDSGKGADGRWDLEGLDRVHTELFDLGPPFSVGEEDTAFLHVIYLSGSYAAHANSEAAGLAHRGIIFVFREVIDEIVPLTPGPALPNLAVERVERAVLIHELGHVLGLVNGGVPMITPREDPNHPRHSTNPESVMYYTGETTYAFMDYIEEGRAVRYTFDENDLKDFAAFRELEARR